MTQYACFRLMLGVDDGDGVTREVSAAGLGWRRDLRASGLGVAKSKRAGEVLELVLGDCACDIYTHAFERVTRLVERLVARRRTVQLLLLASVREPDFVTPAEARTVTELARRGVDALPVGRVVELRAAEVPSAAARPARSRAAARAHAGASRGCTRGPRH